LNEFYSQKSPFLFAWVCDYTNVSAYVIKYFKSWSQVLPNKYGHKESQIPQTVLDLWPSFNCCLPPGQSWVQLPLHVSEVLG
jgi:hypothetical protein